MAKTAIRPAPVVERWPALPLDDWRETYATLHRYMQVVGKLTLHAPPVNQWWHVAFHTTARGLTTGPIPDGARTFDVELDFIDHAAVFRTCEGDTRALALIPRPVSTFYEEVRAVLEALDIGLGEWPVPVEIPDPIPFPEDRRHHTYDPEPVARWWQITRQLDLVLKEFRGRFVGKCSPVHFFWGSFDLAVTRFSGRPAPPRPKADRITRLAYDAECISLGFWPGAGPIDFPALYSYTWPEPPGLAEQKVRPTSAFYSPELKEFVLPYDDVRRATDPIQTVLDFAQSTYEAGATLAGWDRRALERP